ncbi:hypothetical protein ACFX2I_037139 [Malus domestica]
MRTSNTPMHRSFGPHPSLENGDQDRDRERKTEKAEIAYENKNQDKETDKAPPADWALPADWVPIREETDKGLERSGGFKIDVIMEDNTNQHNFLMIGRHAEKILRVSCHILVMQEGYEDPFVAPPILANLVDQSKTFQVSFGNQNSNFGKTNFIVHELLEDKPLSKLAIP